MHVIEWMSTYNAGFGLMGEQGTEAVHAHFNKQSAEAEMHYTRSSSKCVSNSQCPEA